MLAVANGVGRVIGGISDFVSVCVHALNGKRLEILTPNLGSGSASTDYNVIRCALPGVGMHVNRTA